MKVSARIYDTNPNFKDGASKVEMYRLMQRKLLISQLKFSHEVKLSFRYGLKRKVKSNGMMTD